MAKYRKFPKEWSEIHFKEYPRFGKIKFSKEHTKNYLELVLKKRSSKRKFKEYPIKSAELSKLLLFSCGITRPNKDINKTRRPYPSAGARYPLEMYPLILRSEMGTGLFHYNVRLHCLENLWGKNFIPLLLKSTLDKKIAKASVILIITEIPKRSMIKYNEFGHKYILIEAGHVAQNICLMAESMNLKSYVIGGFDNKIINKLLDIDGEYESSIYLIVVGK